MFRFYKLYSLYMNNMTSGLTRPREWCLCEKLPRAVLHIPVNRHLLCEVCGLARRPQAGLASSSDEDADVQRNLPEQRHAEEPKKGQVSRVKVAIRAKKPKDKRCCRTSCVKCGGLARAEAGQEGTGTGGPEEVKSKVYAGRHGLYSKPRGMPRRQQEPTAPPPSSPSPPSSPRAAPPPPTPPPPPPLSGSPPSLVAMAHDVFSRTNHLSQNYSHLFVSNFIPLQSPITDTFGGAISKRNPPPRSHRSRPLPPLSKILTNNQKELDNREKGGGLGRTKSRDSLDIANELASQFCPFERYEGPSEDALVENSARQLLHRPKSLFIEPRQDLPNNRIESLSRSNEGNENLSGIFFMTKSVRENLIKTINQIGFDCSTSSNKSSSTNLNYHSPIHQQTVQETLAEKYERLQAERSSIMTSIMDQLFSLQAESSEEDKVEKTPEMDELDLTINNLSPEDPETGSLLSDVSTEQTVISSNKTKPYQDYTKLFSKTLSNSSWEREFIKVEDSSPNTTEKESQSISLKCGRCGNVKQNSEQDLKKNIGASRIPRKLDQVNINKRKVAEVKVAKGGFTKQKNREKIPNDNSMKKLRICHASQPCKIHQCVTNLHNIFQSEKNIMEGKTGPVINVRPRNNTSKKQEEYLKKKDIRPKDANLIRTRIPVNSFGVCRYKEPSTNWGVVKTFEIISHMCREIPKLQVATFARDLMNTGKVIFSYIKESLVTDQPTMSLYEFRLPDINPNELQSYRNQGKNTDNDSRSKTPITHLATPRISSPSVRQRKKHRKPCIPVWPAHPMKYRSRKIHYEELELSFKTQNTEGLNNNLLHQNNKVIRKEKICTSIYEAQNFSQEDFLFDTSPEKDTKSKPIKLIIANLNDNKSSQSDVFESQSEHVKWDTKDNDLDSSRKEQNEKRESEFETKTRKNNSLDFNIMPKEQKDIPQDRSNQEKPLKSYSSSKLSYDIRRQIDKSMQLKLKKMMSKPIKLLNSAEAGSVVKFLEPFTNRLGVSEENNQNASQISLKQNSEMERNRIHKDSEEYGVLSHASETLKEFRNAKNSVVSEDSIDFIPSTSNYILSTPRLGETFPKRQNPHSEKKDLSQKPLRLITNMSSSSDYESKCLHMGCRSENDSDAASEPIMTYRTTEYEGLPPLNWQVISMGSARLKESIEDLSESEEEYVCPVYKCGNLLKSKTFASHFEQFHRHKTATNALPQEYCHRIVEGLPKQFFFDGDLLTKGNSFVSLLLYSSLKKESSFPLREYPLALLAAPQKVNNKHPTGIFFWLVGYPLGAKLVAKLTVYDPLEQVGRSRIIKPRDLSREQDPRRFHSNCRDHLLITVPYKKQRRFQISVVIDEKSE
ncbi:putative leucine-rich repeat-containing protein DDB_G0290503 isoform X2 [Drosophila takahashii]|uniref:putative leucine-rich repeat-containing protein DDB_G0290503 isoform X2 n=1 Tax=Drosophila takahashii TaxID=29030 RepID=UPI0038992E6C